MAKKKRIKLKKRKATSRKANKPVFSFSPKKRKPASTKKVLKDLKSIIKSIGKVKKAREKETELQRYEKLLGEEFETLAEAKRAFKKQTRPTKEHKRKKGPQRPVSEKQGLSPEEEWEEWAITFRYE